MTGRECIQTMHAYDRERAAQWLANLSDDLIADRAAETTTADPLYYGIIDEMPMVTANGHHSYVDYYDIEMAESLTFAELVEKLDQFDSLSWLIDSDILERTDAGDVSIIDRCEFESYLDSIDIEPIYMIDVEYIVGNRLFLTREDAKKHLVQNAHRFSPKARTYAMCALRSPRYEHLIDLLREIDFSKSTLVFRHDTDQE